MSDDEILNSNMKRIFAIISTYNNMYEKSIKNSESSDSKQNYDNWKSDDPNYVGRRPRFTEEEFNKMFPS